MLSKVFSLQVSACKREVLSRPGLLEPETVGILHPDQGRAHCGEVDSARLQLDIT